MTTPEPRRLPEQGMARALNKGAPGQQQGRMTGLSPVPRRDGSRSRRAAPPGVTSGLIVTGTTSWSEVDSWGDEAQNWDTSVFPGVGLTVGAYLASVTVSLLSIASGKYVRAGLAYQFSGAFAHTPPENVAQGQMGEVNMSAAGGFFLDADDSYAIDVFANRYTSATGLFDAAVSNPGIYLSLVRLSS